MILNLLHSWTLEVRADQSNTSPVCLEGQLGGIRKEQNLGSHIIFGPKKEQKEEEIESNKFILRKFVEYSSDVCISYNPHENTHLLHVVWKNYIYRMWVLFGYFC